MGDVDQARTAATAMMPTIKEALDQMVAVPSVAFPGYPPEPVHQMADTVLGLFQEVGITNARCRRCPTGTRRSTARSRGRPGRRWSMLYAHYDVQPAPPEQGWTSDPWTPTKKDDGRVYGRGAADDKGGLAIHLGTLRDFDGSPPCTIKLIVEGMEETSCNLEAVRRGPPRSVRVRPLRRVRHGQPRGRGADAHDDPPRRRRLRRDREDPRAPPALRRVRRARARRDDGARAAARDPARRPGQRRGRRRDLVRLGRHGLRRGGPPSRRGHARRCRGGRERLGGIAPVVPPVDLGDRDRHDLDRRVLERAAAGRQGQALDADRPRLRPARSSMRSCGTSRPTRPGARPSRSSARRRRRRSGARQVGPGTPRRVSRWQEAYGSAPGEAGSGGSIPLLRTLQQAAPDAEFILWGPEDVAKSRIHASDESVDPAEIEKMIVAQIRLLEHLAGNGLTFSRAGARAGA